uniref:Uncharacterized protein n=1 Tax=uncultured prokaryote TaxID=198431 RepID=A0A0H5PXV2_9ZZZZ|nr:hypothetical protein [uncultured prokaryote]
MFRVIIAGTRYFNDYALLCEYADKVLARKRAEGEIVIVSGHCREVPGGGRAFFDMSMTVGFCR